MDKANFEREHNNFFKKLKEISEIWRAITSTSEWNWNFRRCTSVSKDECLTMTGGKRGKSEITFYERYRRKKDKSVPTKIKYKAKSSKSNPKSAISGLGRT